jgi:hypothetical protein
MNRSATSPAPLPVAPRFKDHRSPDLSSNMDSAFPRFPTSRSATPGTPQSAQSQPRDRLEPNYKQLYAPPSPLFAPLSPRTNGGENITKRMDNIAPGPFDGRRPSFTSAPQPPVPEVQPLRPETQSSGHRRTDTQSSVRSTGSMSRLRTSLKSISSNFSARSGSVSSRNRSSGPNGDVPPLPRTNEQPEGIDAFLGRLQSEAVRPTPLNEGSRSQTYPTRSESQDRRQPPPRPRRPSTRDLPPENISELKVSDFVSQTDSRLSSREPIYPRSQSATRQNDSRAPSRSRSPQPPVMPSNPPNGDAPLAPLHTPSDSGLSDGSYASYRSQSVASSRSSPPESEAGHSRQASKISRPDNFTEETYQRAVTPESFVESRPPPLQMHRRGESVNRLKPISYEPLPRVLSPGYASAPESPMDPAIQFGIGFERQAREPYRSRNVEQNVEKSPPRRMNSREPESRRAAPANKGKCRGCSEPIVGKSVKDSSGRLTGRYHKHCFVCRTCSDPFPTAEFYVFENSPYCEQHYHELNGSLCNSCNRGIEGQYLETDQRLKFHPKCFTCSTCRIVLNADYYEVGGQKFCERHAHRAAPPQNYLGPGDYRPRNLQKRRTRIMMM